MAMDVGQLLADHGFAPAGAGASGPTGFFGTGTDGLFNPALNVTNGNATWAPEGGFYTATSNAANPSTLSTGTGMTAGIVGISGETCRSPQTTQTYTLSANNSIATHLTVSAQTVVNGIDVYISEGSKSVTLVLTDYTGSSLLASASVTTPVGGGWTRFTFGTPQTLQTGRTYGVTVENTSGGTVTVSLTQSVTNDAVAFSFSQPTTFTFTAPSLDGAPVIKQFTSINIPQYVTVSVDKRCKGLIMLCQGNVTINGSISMDYLGAFADPTDMVNNPAYASIDKATFLYDPTQPQTKNRIIVIGPGGDGGDGGDGGNCDFAGTLATGGKGGKGSRGTWWGGGRAGGGGGGAALSSTSALLAGGNGGDAVFTGTTGAGGVAVSASASSSAGNAGGQGSGGSGGEYAGAGYATVSGAGGSQGNAGAGAGGGGGVSTMGGPSTAGSGQVPTQGNNYGAGGLILLVVKGNVTLASTAQLSANGQNGASGGAGTQNNNQGAGGGGAGGGGAGGGVIAILHKGTLSNSGITSVKSGTGGIAGAGSGISAPATNTPRIGIDGVNGKNGHDGVVQFVAI